MNVRHPMGVLNSCSVKNIFLDKMDLRPFSVKNIFYDKMDYLRLFYFRLAVCT